MKWVAALSTLLALACLFYLRKQSLERAAIDLTQASPFLQAFNPVPQSPTPCSSAQSRDASRHGNRIRQVRRATIWAHVDDSAIGQYTSPIESQLLSQLQSANARITSDLRANSTRTIHYEFPNFKGALTIGPFYRDREASCQGAQAILVKADESTFK
jgi:hypothetical protein